MSDLLFSVVIPTFNRPRELATCLNAIAQSSLHKSLFEVIVVNDGGRSLEQPLKKVSPLNVRVLTQQNRGPAAARNFGAGAARGSLIAFTDDDCVPSPEWLTELERSLARDSDALHGGRTVNSLPGNRFSETSQTIIDYVYQYYNDTSVQRTRFFSSNNIAVSACRFRESGGFDESLWTAEDRDYCRTWYDRGWGFRYVPEAIVNHAHDLTFRTLQRQHFFYGRGALPYWRKAARNGSSRLKVEPLGFYRGLLTHPFSRRRQNPALMSALIFVSQLANAAGFAYEAMTTLRATAELVDEPAEAPVASRSY